MADFGERTLIDPLIGVTRSGIALSQPAYNPSGENLVHCGYGPNPLRSAEENKRIADSRQPLIDCLGPSWTNLEQASMDIEMRSYRSI